MPFLSILLLADAAVMRDIVHQKGAGTLMQVTNQRGKDGHERPHNLASLSLSLSSGGWS